MQTHVPRFSMLSCVHACVARAERETLDPCPINLPPPQTDVRPPAILPRLLAFTPTQCMLMARERQRKCRACSRMPAAPARGEGRSFERPIRAIKPPHNSLVRGALSGQPWGYLGPRCDL
jgi:hypothetical protein